MADWTIHTDGASRGNPGHAGIGYTIHDPDGNLVASHSSYIGIATNNVAEYSALIAALKEATGLGVESVRVISDSQLMVNQAKGTYKVKDAGLIPLHAEAKALLRGFLSSSIEHTLRSGNTDADRLASGAITEHLKQEKKAKRQEKQPSPSFVGAGLRPAPTTDAGLTENERKHLTAAIAALKTTIAELEALLSEDGNT